MVGEGERDSVIGVLFINCQVADSIDGCGRYLIRIIILMKNEIISLALI